MAAYEEWQLIEMRPDISLHEAAKDGRVDEVRAWMVDNLEIDSRDRKGYTSFHYAAEHNHLEITKILVDNGADPTLRAGDKVYGPTALHLAASHKPGGQANKETLIYLVETLNLDINAKGTIQRFLVEKQHWKLHATYPLHIACSSENVAGVEFLLGQKKIKMGLLDGDEDSFLHKTCTTNNVQLLELLLEKLKGADQLVMLTLINRRHQTPLHVALCWGYLQMVAKLLEYAETDDLNVKDARIVREYDPSLLLDHSGVKESNVINFLTGLTDLKLVPRRNDGATILHLVSEKGWTRAAGEIIRKEPSLVTEKDNHDRTPLHYAANKNSCEIIGILMEQETTEVDALDEDGRTPLLVAARHGCTDAFNILLEKAALTKRDNEGKNAVFLAAESNHSAILEAAKEKDFSLFIEVDRQENTPLHVAAADGSEKTLQTLLDHCVNTVNARNRLKETAVHLAAKNGHNGSVKKLLAYRPSDIDTDENSCTVDIFAGDCYSNTALHLAARGGHCSVALMLLNKGADVRARNNGSWTPLHFAACYGHQQLVNLLISKYRAEVDAKDDRDWTPLHWAAKQGHLNIVDTLFHHKADLTAVNKDRENALELAIENGHCDVAMAFVKHDQWRSVMCNTSKLPQGREITPMRRLIKKLPEVATEVLNRCTSSYGFSIPDPSSKEYTVIFDYEFLEDTTRSVETNDSGSQHLYHRPSYYFNRLVKSYRVSKSKNEGKQMTGSDWGPARFDRANHPLNIMVDSKQNELLDHPLVKNLIVYKWRKAFLLYLTTVLLYVVFLSFLTAFALLAPNPLSALCQSISNNTFGNANDTIECLNGSNANSFQCGKCGTKQAFLNAAGIIISFYVGFRVIMEFIVFLETLGSYFWNYENWLQLFLYSFTVIFISGLSRRCVCHMPWQWQIGSLAIFLAWIYLFIFIKKLPLFGLYIIMFENIVWTFVKIAIVGLLLLAAFSMAFYMIFFAPSPLFAASPFAAPGLSTIKAMTMAVGEMDFETIFRLTSGGVGDIDDVPTPIPYTVASFLLWILFLILMPILFINLLIGVTVGDVEKIQSNAKYRKIALQIDLALKMEELFPVFRTWFVPTKEDEIDGNIKRERLSLFEPNKYSQNKRVRSVLAGVYPNLTGEKISKSLSVSDPDHASKEPIGIEHVHKQTTEMADLKAELKTELQMVHKKNRHIEKVLELLAREMTIDIAELDEEEDD